MHKRPTRGVKLSCGRYLLAVPLILLFTRARLRALRLLLRGREAKSTQHEIAACREIR